MSLTDKATGTTVPMIYAGTDAAGKSMWTAVLSIPSTAQPGWYMVNANAVKCSDGSQVALSAHGDYQVS